MPVNPAQSSADQGAGKRRMFESETTPVYAQSRSVGSRFRNGVKSRLRRVARHPVQQRLTVRIRLSASDAGLLAGCFIQSGAVLHRQGGGPFWHQAGTHCRHYRRVFMWQSDPAFSVHHYRHPASRSSASCSGSSQGRINLAHLPPDFGARPAGVQAWWLIRPCFTGRDSICLCASDAKATPTASGRTSSCRH